MKHCCWRSIQTFHIFSVQVRIYAAHLKDQDKRLANGSNILHRSQCAMPSDLALLPKKEIKGNNSCCLALALPRLCLVRSQTHTLPPSIQNPHGGEAKTQLSSSICFPLRFDCSQQNYQSSLISSVTQSMCAAKSRKRAQEENWKSNSKRPLNTGDQFFFFCLFFI